MLVVLVVRERERDTQLDRGSSDHMIEALEICLRYNAKSTAEHPMGNVRKHRPISGEYHKRLYTESAPPRPAPFRRENCPGITTFLIDVFATSACPSDDHQKGAQFFWQSTSAKVKESEANCQIDSLQLFERPEQCHQEVQLVSVMSHHQPQPHFIKKRASGHNNDSHQHQRRTHPTTLA